MAYLRPSAILGAEELSRQALGVIGVHTSDDGRIQSILDGTVPIPSTPPSPPLSNATAPTAVPMVYEPCKLFYGTQMAYIFFRLHHILYTRLALARQLAQSESTNVKASHPLAYLDEASDDENDRNAIDPGTGTGVNSKLINRYGVYLGQLYAHLGGTIDSNKYEESCRSLLGNRAFVLYTLDKVIISIIKCLQAMANDDIVNKLIGLFVFHRSYTTANKREPTPEKGGPEPENKSGLAVEAAEKRGVDPEFYLNHVSAILSHTMEDVYRIQVSCVSLLL